MIKYLLFIGIFSINSSFAQLLSTPQSNIRPILSKAKNVLLKMQKVIGESKICETKFYNTKPLEPSELMKKMIKESIKLPKDSWTVQRKFRFPNGYVSTAPLRGGSKIFEGMANLIRMAEHEVLFETMIYELNSLGAKILYSGIVDLYKKRKKLYSKLGDKLKPIRIKFIFDIVGSNKKYNLFELMTTGRGGGIEFGTKGYKIDFPLELDPKIIKFEIKGHRHKDLLSVTHAKSIIVDRKVAIITGANVVGYHFSKEVDHTKDEQLMVDHGFHVYGQVAHSMADDYFNLWYKEEGKRNGWADHYSGNFEGPKNEKKEYLKRHGNPPWPGHKKAIKSFPNIRGVKLIHWKKVHNFMMATRKSSHVWKTLAPLNILKLFHRNQLKKRLRKAGNSPQNMAILNMFKFAKSHINVVTPSLNSTDFMAALSDALYRGVDVNMLISKNYQNYNGPLQEEGTNKEAVEKLLEINQFLKETYPEKKLGDLNIKWFVTRGGLISGKKEGQRTEKWRIVLNEKFWNHNHTKFISVDNQLAIIGSANLDEQSYYNSRELNLLIDGHQAVKRLCKKVFKTDFLRAKGVGIKKFAGEKCWRNRDCAESRKLFCDNTFIAGSFKCVYRPGHSLSGGFCLKDKECKTKMCNIKDNQCL